MHREASEELQITMSTPTCGYTPILTLTEQQQRLLVGPASRQVQQSNSIKSGVKVRGGVSCCSDQRGDAMASKRGKLPKLEGKLLKYGSKSIQVLEY